LVKREIKNGEEKSIYLTHSILVNTLPMRTVFESFYWKKVNMAGASASRPGEPSPREEAT